MSRGIVIQLEEKYIMVMRSTGQLDKIPRGKRVCQVGEEITYNLPAKSSIKGLVAAIIALSAALIFCFYLIHKLSGVSSSDEVIAYVTIDINPSIEIGIDEETIVRELRGLNSAGEQIIKNMDYKKKKLESVVASILDQAERGPLKEKQAAIVLASSTVVDRSALSDVVLANQLKEQATKHIQATHPNNADSYMIISMAVSSELRQASKPTGLSMGQYALYLKLKSLGIVQIPNQLQDQSILLFTEQVEGLKEELLSSQAMSKSTLNKLLLQEQMGEEEPAPEKPTREEEPETSDEPSVTPRPTPKPDPTATPQPTPTPTPTPTLPDSPEPSISPDLPGDTEGPTENPDEDVPDPNPTDLPDLEPSETPDGSVQPDSTPTDSVPDTSVPDLFPWPSPEPTPEEPSVG